MDGLVGTAAQFLHLVAGSLVHLAGGSQGINILVQVALAANMTGFQAQPDDYFQGQTRFGERDDGVDGCVMISVPAEGVEFKV